MKFEVVDFQDIQDAVREELRIQSTDSVAVNRIKRVINQVYLQEVVPFARWKWLEGSYRTIHKARYNTETAAVTPLSNEVTLSVAPSIDLGSFAGRKFAVEGYNEIYVISEHIPGTDTFTLTSNYTGNLSNAVSFKIWTDIVPLPEDCRETVNVFHNFNAKPMEGVGLQKFRALTTGNPRAEAPPGIYYTGDFFDPSMETPEQDVDRYRRMYVYPAISKTDITIQVDYIKTVSAMDLPGDEPVMPVEDRIVLVYGALSRLFKSINSNTEQASLAKSDFNSKLVRMSGKVEDSQDSTKLRPDSSYVKSRRAPRFVSTLGHSAAGLSGGSGYEQIQYLKDVTINGGKLINNLEVNDGVLIDGVDISEISGDITGVANDLEEHIDSSFEAHNASAIALQPIINLTSVNVQDAVGELEDKKINAPESAALNVVARYDDSGGKGLLSSSVYIDDDAHIYQGPSGQGIIRTRRYAYNLPNNLSVPTAILSVPHADYPVLNVSYGIRRGASNIETGTIYIVTDGTNYSFTPICTSIGAVDVTFSVDISGDNVRLLVTTSNATDISNLVYSYVGIKI